MQKAHTTVLNSSVAVRGRVKEIMNKVRVGVIGAGSWAIASHLPNLAKHNDLEYVGISRKGTDILTRILTGQILHLYLESFPSNGFQEAYTWT